MIMVIVDDYDHDYGAILHRHNLFCFARHIVQRWWQMWRELSLWRNAATDLPPDWHNCDIIVCYFLFPRMYIFKPFLLPGELEGHCSLRFSWIDCKINYFQWFDGQNQRSNCFKGGLASCAWLHQRLRNLQSPQFSGDWTLSFFWVELHQSLSQAIVWRHARLRCVWPAWCTENGWDALRCITCARCQRWLSCFSSSVIEGKAL